jgi:ABC-type branched-subunit amino acid transport system ATPase component
VIALNLDTLKINLGNLISRIAQQLVKHGLLKNRDELEENDQKFLERVLDNRLDVMKDLPYALVRLTEILHALNKREVIVLIDEYDTPTYSSHALVRS